MLFQPNIVVVTWSVTRSNLLVIKEFQVQASVFQMMSLIISQHYHKLEYHMDASIYEELHMEAAHS